jgi:glycosyltransferase involved in cell wall biosynthesis
MGSNYDEMDGAKLFKYSFLGYWKLYWFFRKKKNLVVLFHSFSFPISFLFFQLLLGKKAKWIVQHHAGEPSKNLIKRAVQKITFSRASKYLFVTKDQASNYVKHGLIKSIDYVNEVMELSTGFHLLSKDECRDELQIEKDKQVYIWVGHLEKNKNPMCALIAFKKLKEVSSEFLVYMFFEKTELLREMKEFIEFNKLDNHILEKWYNAADYFVACSHSEGSGTSAAEAMACGCTPVLSSIPSFLFMTSNGEIGYNFETGKPGEMAKILVHLSKYSMIDDRENIRKQFDVKLSHKAIGKGISEVTNQLQ